MVWQARRRWPARLARPPDQHTDHMYLKLLLETASHLSWFLVLASLGASRVPGLAFPLAPSSVSFATIGNCRLERVSSRNIVRM